MPKRSTQIGEIIDTPYSRAVRPSHCCWPMCYDRVSDRYGVPICEDHVRMLTKRANNIDDASRRLSQRRDKLPQQLRATEIRARAAEKRVEELEGQIYGSDGPPPPTPAPAKAATPVNGTVYVLRNSGYIKIGWTSDLAKRMRAYPPDSSLLATMPGTRKDESRLHKRFAHLRTHGREWYPLAPQITEYAALLITQHGEPEKVQFAAKPVEVPMPHRLNSMRPKTFGQLAR